MMHGHRVYLSGALTAFGLAAWLVAAVLLLGGDQECL